MLHKVEVGRIEYQITSPSAPLQIEGTIDEHPFYFRERHGYYYVASEPVGIYADAMMDRRTWAAGKWVPLHDGLPCEYEIVFAMGIITAAYDARWCLR